MCLLFFFFSSRRRHTRCALVTGSDVCSSDLTARLPRDVADYEPAGALFAGVDGLDDYRRLIPQLPALFAPEGRAFLEIGSAQAGPVIEIAAAAGLGATTRRDLAGLGRCIRSEEHTSELQSVMRISYAVFCLKKKKKTLHAAY